MDLRGIGAAWHTTRVVACLSRCDFVRSRAGRSLVPRRPAKRGFRPSFRALRRLRPEVVPQVANTPTKSHSTSDNVLRTGGFGPTGYRGNPSSTRIDPCLTSGFVGNRQPAATQSEGLKRCPPRRALPSLRRLRVQRLETTKSHSISGGPETARGRKVEQGGNNSPRRNGFVKTAARPPPRNA